MLSWYRFDHRGLLRSGSIAMLRLREFGWIVLWQGLASLLILSQLGRAIAVLCLITVIGLPIVLVLGAIPTMFIYSLLVFLSWLGLSRLGLRAPTFEMWGGFAIGAALMFLIPLAQNARITW
jgi:hypothetical protein